MKYLDFFDVASENDEAKFVLSFNYKVEMTCFSENVYPFKIFPEKYFSHADFDDITVIYGGNGSGKSTFLNIIAEKLALIRKAPFNRTPYFDEYLSFCKYGLTKAFLPSESRIITSDEIFDFLLDLRAINDGVDTFKSENELLAFKNIFNDWYARDTSKKIRAVFKTKGQSGKHLSNPLYGYKHSETDKNLWLIDD